MEVASPPFVSVEKYLEAEYRSQKRHEYLAGEVRAMGYASEEHELIVSNFVRLLGNCLFKSECRVYPSNRMLHIPECERFFYADVLVVCGPTEFFQYKKKMKATLNPSVIIEVLSDSTEAIDQNEKWHCYQKIKSLRNYVLVSQQSPFVEIYRRVEDTNDWYYTSANDLSKRVKIGDCEMSLEEIYENVISKSI